MHAPSVHLNRNLPLSGTIAYILVSLAIQIPLAILLGHDYDLHVFMTTGSIVAHGDSPYEFEGQTLIPGTSNQAIGSIGYPPPWGLYLATAFAVSYNLIPNLLLYNLAIKIPIITANIALALLARRTCPNSVWLIFLFHPFVLYVSSAWGQFDGVVALFITLSILLLTHQRFGLSAMCLAFAVSLKILPIVLLPMVLLYLHWNSPRSRLGSYLIVFVGFSMVANVSPFLILGWSVEPILTGWNFHFSAAGAMTPFNILELTFDVTTLTAAFTPLGFLWIPTVIGVYWGLSRTRLDRLDDLLRWSSVIIFALLLSRAWTSEQNVYLLLPLMALSVGRVFSWRSLHLALIIPLVFTLLNFSLPQMFLLLQPALRDSISLIDAMIREGRLLARFLVVLVWDAVGIWIVAQALKVSRTNS
jgi:hypothetical protein